MYMHECVQEAVDVCASHNLLTVML